MPPQPEVEDAKEIAPLEHSMLNREMSGAGVVLRIDLVTGHAEVIIKAHQRLDGELMFAVAQEVVSAKAHVLMDLTSVQDLIVCVEELVEIPDRLGLNVELCRARGRRRQRNAERRCKTKTRRAPCRDCQPSSKVIHAIMVSALKGDSNPTRPTA